MKYVYTGRAIVPVKAQIVGEEIERLAEENEGTLLPETILLAAKRKKSVLHPCFEWDDAKAAHKYRTEQASYLLRVVVTVVTPPGQSRAVEVRAFPCIETDGRNYYTTCTRVYESQELTENVDAQIYRELINLRNKYRTHKKFVKVWQAVDSVKV